MDGYNKQQLEADSKSTMQKTPLDQILSTPEYSKKLFHKSMQLISSCKKIPINVVSAMHKEEGVRKRYQGIEDKLMAVLKGLRNFTDTEKPVFSGAMELAGEILEEMKVQVQIQFRKAQQQKNTVKLAKSQLQTRKPRPQSLYPNIKPFPNFDEHCHQELLQSNKFPAIPPCPAIVPPAPLETPYTYIDTPQKLALAIQQLKAHTEIAVDVEHSSKSYEGFTCLIQISSREKDYIVDVLPIWDSVGLLNEVIGDPAILKVMHGAEMDTKWLQRDFNIHIVNLFDTYRAARVLGMPKFSYAYLLNHYCNVTTNKIYQRADWRERPLSTQMLKYARMDTHYLLTIYDHLRKDLQAQSRTIANISLRDVFYDIQKSSHEVTLANAELFSYKTRELYKNLQIQFLDKKSQFRAVQAIFSQISYVAMKEDQNFDDLISSNELSLALSMVKDLTFNQKSKISREARIQRVVTALGKAGHQCLREAIVNIKNVLMEVFCDQKVEANEPIKPAASKTVQPQQQLYRPQKSPQSISQQPHPQFTRTKTSIKFNQLPYRSFNPISPPIPSHTVPKPAIAFLPLTVYLSAKYGIQQVKQQDHVMEEESAEMDEEVEEGQGQGEEDEEEKGVIEFKRMNPNVIYTIEEQDPQVGAALDKQKPRKARKQTQYQNRIRGQKGNIYDLLDHS